MTRYTVCSGSELTPDPPDWWKQDIPVYLAADVDQAMRDAVKLAERLRDYRQARIMSHYGLDMPRVHEALSLDADYQLAQAFLAAHGQDIK